jgi:hypothetical protein
MEVACVSDGTIHHTERRFVDWIAEAARRQRKEDRRRSKASRKASPVRRRRRKSEPGS